MPFGSVVQILLERDAFFFAKNHFPTQNLLSDAECKICKYKSLIISVYYSNCGRQILCRGTVGRRKIGKNLQI